MTKLQSALVLAASTAAIVQGFAPASIRVSPTQSNNAPITHTPFQQSLTTATRHSMALQAEKKSNKVDPNLKNKLLAETIAPWRGLRLFLYASFASGAFVGGLITASGLAAALSGARTDVDVNADYLNLAIDFGAVALFGVLAKWDLDKGAELDVAVEEKVERKKEQKILAGAMRERETLLKDLSINVRVTEDGGTKMAPVGIMQERAKQHVILVAGPGRAIRDALRGAQLNKVNFAMTNILVIPYETGVGAADRGSRPDGSGFGEDSRPSYETQPYVAEPVGEGWEEFIAAEMDTAANQAGDKVRDEGVALVVTNDGKVLRRGVGKVPWRQMVDELEEAVTGEKKEVGLGLVEFLE